MYGLETIRGSNRIIDHLARAYTSYASIDWSGYDQHLPRPITDCFFTDFLRRLIVINNGYTPTFEYPAYPDLTTEHMYERMDNLLHFLHLWYNNMTFLTADGYAYRRLFAGVPSGLYLTQYLDSFGNLYLIIDALIEFGCSDAEINDILMFVLGDDNLFMTRWPLGKLQEFINFMEDYSKRRWNMTLSKTKSVITRLRNKIESLGYQCNNGSPTRPIGKLVAQLVYPERGHNPKHTAMRAIGLAYASAGQDRTFHRFCYDVYMKFASQLELDDAALLRFSRSMPIFSSDDNPDLDELRILVTRFPTIPDIQSLLEKYQGPLAYTPKWNSAHFVNSPDMIPPDSMTMYEYEQLHSLQVRAAPNLLHVNDLDKDSHFL